ncbi:hypothetical protein GKR76_08215 [Providencia alcalifaciens]|nr:hypothetical protein [Providencia alcalifaciens]MTC26652.1 hypothetical protein [Providencia alcalifaciens]
MLSFKQVSRCNHQLTQAFIDVTHKTHLLKFVIKSDIRSVHREEDYTDSSLKRKDLSGIQKYFLILRDNFYI